MTKIILGATIGHLVSAGANDLSKISDVLNGITQGK